MNTLRHPSLCTRNGMVHAIRKLWLLPILFSFFAVTSGCNESGMPAGLFTKIMSTTPASNAVNQPVNATISVTFSEVMDTTSIHEGTFIVKHSTIIISGTYSYSGDTVVFTPSIPLGYGSTYTVMINSDIESLSGAGLADNHEWSFSTEEGENSDLPQVISTNPAHNAKDVLPNSAIMVFFDKPMNSSSLNTSTFTVYQGSTPISGHVSSTNGTATFSPINALSSGSTYQAMISADVEDTLGNKLNNDFEWSFSALDEPESTPPQIESVNPSDDERNVPADVVISASFSKVLDNTSVNSSTFLITQNGNAVSGSIDVSGSTISFTTSTDLPYEAVVNAVITSGVKDQAGDSLPANYEWSFVIMEEQDNIPPEIISTNPSPNATHVDVVSHITATFSEPINASTLNNSTIIVNGGGTISGNISYSESDNKVTFRPVNQLQENTTYTATITTGVEDLAGNALENNFEWTFYTPQGSDNIPPQVESVNPSDAETKVPVEQVIEASFSKDLDNSSVNSSTFLITQNGNAVSGSIDISGSTLSFTPGNDFPYEAVVTAVLTTDVKDQAGNSLPDNYEWSFVVVEEQDDIPPKIISISPADNENEVDEDSEISATFSEPMNESTINNSTFIVTGRGRVSGNISYSDNTVTFTPNSDLRENRTYTVTITTGVEDLAENALESEVSWTFRTEDD